MKDGLNIPSLPSPQDRYTLEKKLGTGVFGEVHIAKDNQAAGKAVAIKIQILTEESDPHIQDEYKILRDFTKHPNVVDFYGVFCDKSEYVKKIWFVIEVCSCNSLVEPHLEIQQKELSHQLQRFSIFQLCEYGSVIDIVRKLKAVDKKMSEEHIAYILKYTIKVSPYSTDYKHVVRHIRVKMAVYKTKGLPVQLSTAESIGGYFECKLNCSRSCVRAIPSLGVTWNKI